MLDKEFKICESVNFGSSSMFSFTLAVAEIEKTDVKYVHSTIFIILPKSSVDTWIQTDQVGIEEVIEFENGETLQLLIEKDFPCIDRENEDKSDTFYELTGEGKAC